MAKPPTNNLAEVLEWTPEKRAAFHSNGIPSAGGCIIWESAHSPCGTYGICWLSSKPQRRAAAHRVAWVLNTGRPLENREMVRHTCGNQNCINPDHLKTVTFA